MPENPIYESEAAPQPREQRASTRESAARVPLPTSGERLQRRRRTSNPLEFDQRLVPPGFSYEWKRETINGQPDTTHKVEIRENHWRPVPASRHPELAIAGESLIRRGDTVLYERPKYLTEEAQMEDLNEALAPVQQMEEIMYGTKPGQMTRDHPSVRKISSVRQQWSPGDPIPEGQSSDP